MTVRTLAQTIAALTNREYPFKHDTFARLLEWAGVARAMHEGAQGDPRDRMTQLCNGLEGELSSQSAKVGARLQSLVKRQRTALQAFDAESVNAELLSVSGTLLVLCKARHDELQEEDDLRFGSSDESLRKQVVEYLSRLRLLARKASTAGPRKQLQVLSYLEAHLTALHGSLKLEIHPRPPVLLPWMPPLFQWPAEPALALMALVELAREGYNSFIAPEDALVRIAEGLELAERRHLPAVDFEAAERLNIECALAAAVRLKAWTYAVLGTAGSGRPESRAVLAQVAATMADEARKDAYPDWLRRYLATAGSNTYSQAVNAGKEGLRELVDSFADQMQGIVLRFERSGWNCQQGNPREVTPDEIFARDPGEGPSLPTREEDLPYVCVLQRPLGGERDRRWAECAGVDFRPRWSQAPMEYQVLCVRDDAQRAMDESDRRAGAAERRRAEALAVHDRIVLERDAVNDLLQRATAEAGFPAGTDFEQVWASTLALANRARAAGLEQAAS